MVNAGLIEIILREQDDPGCSTTRQIRDLYNNRSGEEAIRQNSDEDKEFQSILIKALQALPLGGDKEEEEEDDDDDDDNDEDKPISYTVKLKDSDDGSTPTMKRRSIIKLPKEIQEQSESDEVLSDSEKPSTASSITITKPFSPLFLNNMKKFGVSTDWLAKRSNLLRQSAYSRSSVKSNTIQLDAMIKSASAKPVRSNRKLSFIENSTTTSTKVETDKENTDPSTEINDKKEEASDKEDPEEEEEGETNEKEEEKTTEITNTKEAPITNDLNSDSDDDKEQDIELSPKSKDFSLRIPRVNVADSEKKRSSSVSSTDKSKNKKDLSSKLSSSISIEDKPKKRKKRESKRSNSLSSDDEIKEEKVKPKRKRQSKKDTTKKSSKEEKVNDSPKKSSKKSSKEQKVNETPKKSSKEEKVNETPKKSPTQSDEDEGEVNEIQKKPLASDDENETTTIDDTMESSPKQNKEEPPSTTTDTKKTIQRKSKDDLAQARIEHFKKLLRISGIRLIMKKTELEPFRSNKAKIDYLKSLFDKAGFTGSLTIKECEKFRKKRDTEKELLEIQANSVTVKGHVKGGRTLRGQGREIEEIDLTAKRKRTASSEIEEDEDKSDDDSSDNERKNVKKRRIMKMEASPEISEDE